MNTALSMVNTYACMNATNNSRKSINIVIATLTTVSEVPATTPIWKVMNIMHTNDIIMACPANIFAKRRTIKANGFVNTPKNSISGIIGTGNFNHVGTSGQKISFQ